MKKIIKSLFWSLNVLVFAALMLAACGQPAAPSPAVEAAPPAGPRTSPPAGPAWEEKWNSVLGEARKEGAVIIYNTWSSDTRAALTGAFKDKYGINLEFSTFGNGSQMAAKVQAEKTAGLSLVDFYGVGTPTQNSYLKPQGLLAPIKPLLIRPDVLDPNSWRGGQLPFYDKEGTGLEVVTMVNRAVAYNTNLVKGGEITSFRDLLKPQYKGKIIMLDPSVTGNATIAHLGHNLWGEAEAAEFFRRLVKEQDVVITRDNRLHIETVARGKYAIGFAPSTTVVGEFLGLGAPLKLAIAEEDNRVTAGSGCIAIPPKQAHPNATIVFVNWLLTREGQSVISRSFGIPGTRVDVPTEGIDPLFIPEAGKKYFPYSEEFMKANDKWMAITRKIMEEGSK